MGVSGAVGPALKGAFALAGVTVPRTASGVLGEKPLARQGKAS